MNSFQKESRVFQGCFEGFSLNFHGKVVQRVFQKSLEVFQGSFHEHIKGIQETLNVVSSVFMMYKEDFEVVSRLLQGNFQRASSSFQDCLKNYSMVFDWCFEGPV